TQYTPAAAPYANEPCQGVRLQITDRGAYRPVETALALASALHARHASEWQMTGLTRLLAHARTFAAPQAGTQPGALPKLWQPELSAFAQRRAQVLRYPDCRR